MASDAWWSDPPAYDESDVRTGDLDDVNLTSAKKPDSTREI